MLADMMHTLAMAAPHYVEAGFILSGIKGILVAIGSIIAAILCAIIAAAKGRSALVYGVLGLFFSILTLIVIILLPSRRRRT
jgi:hypothetical protein